MRPFGYLQDGLFLAALGAYTLNRLVILPDFGGDLHARLPATWSFLHGHLDDCLLIPAALPVVLWLQRLLRLRTHDEAPRWGEMTGHLLIWTVMCKWLGPAWWHLGVADPWDVLCFAGGGVAACAWWRSTRAVFTRNPHEF